MVIQKVKHRLKIQSKSSTPMYIPKRTENKCSKKNLYTDVYSCIIHNSQNMGTTHRSNSWWLDKQNVVSSHSEYYSLKRRRDVLILAAIWVHLSNIKWKKPDTATYYMIPFYEMSRIGKSIESESRLMVTRGWEEGGMGSNCIMGMEFLLGGWKYSGIRW